MDSSFAVCLPGFATDGDVVGLDIELNLVHLRDSPRDQHRFDGLAELEQHRRFRTDESSIASSVKAIRLARRTRLPPLQSGAVCSGRTAAP